jgi:hypothetical protein
VAVRVECAGKKRPDLSRSSRDDDLHGTPFSGGFGTSVCAKRLPKDDGCTGKRAML